MSARSDLLAYLGRVTLYCHQLNITSKVKADVHSVSGELVVAGLDSAASLIQVQKQMNQTRKLTCQCRLLGT